MRKTKTKHDMNAFNFLVTTVRSIPNLLDFTDDPQSEACAIVAFILISDPIVGLRISKFVRGEDMTKVRFKQTVGRIIRGARKYVQTAYYTITLGELMEE